MLILCDSLNYFAQAQSGGKGYNLYLLTKHDIPVPSWAILSKSAYESFINDAGISCQLKDITHKYYCGELSAKKTAEQARNLIITSEISIDIKNLILKAYEYIGINSMISVRSSAIDEDGGKHSFAGQLSSFLYVQGLDDAEKFLLECWASAFSERCLEYRKQNDLGVDDISLAVIFQKMIPSEISGVLYTCDPVNHKLEQFVIGAVYGTGEGLVSGELDGDTYWINSKTGLVNDSEIVSKLTEFTLDSNGIYGPNEVSKSKHHKPALDDSNLKDLHSVSLNIKKIYNVPQDIEWAIYESKVYILQSRPITSYKQDPNGYPNLWDNSNIVESYGGITLPLSFSFALENYKNVYTQFCDILSVPPKVVKDMEHYLGNMLGSIDGRIYYNLYNWYKLIGVLPGFKHNKEFMETMMGVEKELPDDVIIRVKPHASWDTPIGSYRKIKTGLTFIYYHFAIQRIVDSFLENFSHSYENFRHIDYSSLDSNKILDHYINMNRVMLGKWKAPIINDFLCMIHFGLLNKLTKDWLGGANENIQNDLLAGDGNIESAEPTKALIRLANKASKDSNLSQLIMGTSNFNLLEALKQSEFQEFYEMVCEYINSFGFRCMDELKLEEKDLYIDPSFLFVCLKNYLQAKITDITIYEKRESLLRNNAEQKVLSILSGWKKVVYLWALKHTRKAVRNRENTRFTRTRAYGVARSMFQAMGKDLYNKGIINHTDDIYYLELKAIYGIHQGTLAGHDLKSYIQLKKKEYTKFEFKEPQNRFQTRGPVYWNNNYIEDSNKCSENSPQTNLQGTGCCPGIVEGIVRIVHSSNDSLLLKGEILVASRTDPGWAPLFPNISGLLVERGSLLSHSATIAREMGIPSIVGIKGLLNTLEDGMRVQLNGQTGAVIILDFKSTELYMNDDVASHTPQKLKNQKHVTFPPSAVG